MKTIADAKSTTIFYVQYGKIVEESYYDYLCEFGQGDDPSGIEEEDRTYYQVDGNEFESEDEAEEYCNENEIDASSIEEITKTFYTHVVRYHANYGRKIKAKGWESEDREVVEHEYIQGLEYYISDKNWDAPDFFSSKEEAEERRIEREAEALGVDVEVFLSIERKQNIVNARRAEIAKIAEEKRKAEEQAVFEKYKNIIPKIEGEKYKECQQRLADSLPERIQGSVFHKIIKYLRA